MNLFKILNPNFFIKITKVTRPYLILLFLISFISGLYFALFASPEDYQQGITVRIMYIHVPAAWISLMIYSLIGILSVSCLVWSANFAFYIALSAAPIGTCYALITLLTGMIWGKPIWGTWWVWDARLTSMLILFIFYLLFMIVASGSDNLEKIKKPASIIGIAGLINVPIIKFSVNLWFSLHQGASVFKIGGPAIDSSMLIPLLLMFFSNFFFFLIILGLKIETLLNKIRSEK